MRSTLAFRRPSRGARSRACGFRFEAGWLRRVPRRGKEYLYAMLDADEGARYLEELGIGTTSASPGRRRTPLRREARWNDASGDRAFYEKTGGKNDSSVHWDLICDLREGGEALRADGEIVQRAAGSRTTTSRREGKGVSRRENGKTMLRVANIEDEAALEGVRDALDALDLVYEHIRSEPDEDTFPQTARYVPDNLADDVDNLVQRLTEEYGFEAEFCDAGGSDAVRYDAVFLDVDSTLLWVHLDAWRVTLRTWRPTRRTDRLPSRGRRGRCGRVCGGIERTSSTARRRTSPSSSAVTPRSPASALGIRAQAVLLAAVADRRISFNPTPSARMCCADSGRWG